MTERVLVLPREDVPGGCDYIGLRWLGDEELVAFRRAVGQSGRWMERDLAEHDPTHKQLIPYVVVRDGARAFLVERTAAGGDAPLHHRATIGAWPRQSGRRWPGPDRDRLRREWDEEIAADWDPHFEPIGLLNDDRNPVGFPSLVPMDTMFDRCKVASKVAQLDSGAST